MCSDIKPKQICIEHLGGVVERARRPGKEKLVFAPFVFDIDPALFNIDVWSAVLSHSTQLHDMALGREVFHSPNTVKRDIEVILKGLSLASRKLRIE